jgi:hypothetical protein
LDEPPSTEELESQYRHTRQRVAAIEESVRADLDEQSDREFQDLVDRHIRDHPLYPIYQELFRSTRRTPYDATSRVGQRYLIAYLAQLSKAVSALKMTSSQPELASVILRSTKGRPFGREWHQRWFG